MEDTLLCPICKNKLRSLKTLDKYLHPIEKISDFYERTCVSAVNHSLQFFVDPESKKIDYLRFSFKPYDGLYIESNFLSGTCNIVCFKENVIKSIITLPKMIELDFPDLVKTREKLSLYVTFS